MEDKKVDKPVMFKPSGEDEATVLSDNTEQVFSNKDKDDSSNETDKSKKFAFSKIGKIVSKLIPKSTDLNKKRKVTKCEQDKTKSKDKLKRQISSSAEQPQKKKLKQGDKISAIDASSAHSVQNQEKYRQVSKSSKNGSTKSKSKRSTKLKDSREDCFKEEIRIQKDIEDIFGKESPDFSSKANQSPETESASTSSKSKSSIKDKERSSLRKQNLIKVKKKEHKSSSKLSEDKTKENTLDHGSNLMKTKVSSNKHSSSSVKSIALESDSKTDTIKNITKTSQIEDDGVNGTESSDCHKKLTEVIKFSELKTSEEDKEVTKITSTASEKHNQSSKELNMLKLEDTVCKVVRYSSRNAKKKSNSRSSSRSSSRNSVQLVSESKKTSSLFSEDSSSNSSQHESKVVLKVETEDNGICSFTPLSAELSQGGSRSSSRLSNVSYPTSRLEGSSMDSNSFSTLKQDSKDSFKSSSETGSRQSSKFNSRAGSRQSSRSGTPTEVGCLGMEQLRLLSEQLSSLNENSSNLTTQMYRKQTPSKKSCLTRKASTTPRKTPLKSSRLKDAPKTTPGKRNKLHLSPKSTTSPRVFRSPNKSKPKRRLYEKSPSTKSRKRKLSIETPDEKSSAKTKRKLKVKFQFKSPEGGEDVLDCSSEEVQSAEDSDALEIASDVEELDIQLSNKSKKLKLTARNVKSIIHQVIKNEHVSDLFRKSLLDEQLEDQLKEAIFEPKMTRAKVKEVMEKGNFPPPWTLSPIKGLKQSSTESKPSILDINFPDNEEDQEYKPTPEELEQTDDDEGSILSSQASDFGSPIIPSPAPTTPSARLLPSESSSTPRALFQDTAASDVEEELIASRTRSKLPLKNTTIDAIESNFVAPDITPDMYDTNCNDHDWTEFLNSLTKDETQLNDTYDDEQNDPEFNFLEEQEQEELDKEDFRDDKAVRISKKELNELMDELFEAYGGADLLDDDENTRDSLNQSGHELETVKHPPYVKKKEVEEGTLRPPVQKKTEKDNPIESTAMPPPPPKQKYPGHIPPLKLDPHLASILVNDLMKIQGKNETDVESESSERSTSPDDLGQATVTDETIIQIQDQMRKHVQLLAQTYVQAGDHHCHKKVSEIASSYLLEVQHLGNQSIKNGCPQSYFHAPNLKGALEICQVEYTDDAEDLKKKVKEIIVYDKLMSGANFDIFGLSYQQMDLFMNNKVFVFPQMIPENRFPIVNIPDKKRVTFTEAEDNLLAIGLDQFGSMPNKYSYIQKFLLPVKTQEQLRIRCKNLKGRAKDENVLQLYQKTKKLPVFERYLQLEIIEDIVSPRERDFELLPRWASSYENIRCKLGLGSDRQFIPIEPSGTNSAQSSRCSTPSTAVLKTKKVSKDDPTDKTLGVTAMQHFNVIDSAPGSAASSRCSTPTLIDETSSMQAEASSNITIANASLQPNISKAVEIIQQQLEKESQHGEQGMRTRSLSGSSTDTAQSTPLAQISPATSSADIFKQYPADITSSSFPADSRVSIMNNETLSNIMSSSGYANQVSSSVSAVVQSNTKSFSTPQKSNEVFSLSKHSLQSTAPSTPQLVHILTTAVSSPVTWTTPEKMSDVTSDIGSPSLIGAAMAEAMGICVEELKTPEGIKKIGITPSKVPGIVPLVQKSVKKSLASMYDASLNKTPQQIIAQSTKSVASGDTVEVKDKKTEQKNTNIIMSILQEVNDTKKTSQTSESQASSTTKEQEQPVASTRMPVTPTSDPFKSSDCFKISPVSLNLIAETSTMFPDKPFNKPIDFDANSILVTPKKITFDDDQGNSTSRTSFPTVSPSSLLGSPCKSGQLFSMGVLDTPSKTAVKIMAEFAEGILSPEKSLNKIDTMENSNSFASASSKETPTTPIPVDVTTPSRKSAAVPCQGRKELNFTGKISPKKTTPSKCVPILPAGPIPISPMKSPMIPKVKTTPRRQILQQKARAIAPKGLVINTYVSPVKQVAAAITAKAKHYLSPQKKLVGSGGLRPILPKAPVIPPVSRRIFSPTPNDNDGNKDTEDYITEGSEYLSDKDLEEEEFVMTRRQRKLLKKQRLQQLKDEDKENDTPSDPGQESQDELDEDDEEHLAQLMAASTTIRFDPKQQDSTQLRSKGQIKKDTILEMLAPDLLQSDPMRDERDTVFAQSYLNKVRDSLADEQDKYSEFLRLLYDFGKSKCSPVQLYQDMYHLFAGHPELLEDFSSFLLPDQAKDCGCLMAHLEFQKARTFLRKLELHFKRLPGMLQRVLKAFAKWEKLPTKNIKDLQAEIRPLLKGQQYLLDEFATFFEEERVPDSYMTDFEEVNFLSGDEDNADLFDGYEEVEIPGGGDSLYGTSLCICKCHIDTTCMEYKEKRKHCISCGIKIVRGRLYLQSDKKLRPLHIRFNQPVKMPAHLENENLSEEEELEADEEELSLSEAEEGDIDGDKVIEQEALEEEEEEDDIDDKVIDQEGIDDDEYDVDDKAIVEQEAIIDDEEDIDEKGAELEDDDDENDDDINNESESGDENEDINNESESDENYDERETGVEDDNEKMNVNSDNLDSKVNYAVECEKQSQNVIENGIDGVLDKSGCTSTENKENLDNLSEDEQGDEDTELEEAGSDPDGDVIEEGDGEDVEDLDPDSNEIQNGMSEKENSAESCEEKEEDQSDQESRSLQNYQKEHTPSPTVGPTDFSSLRNEIQQSKLMSSDAIASDMFADDNVGISSSLTDRSCDSPKNVSNDFDRTSSKQSSSKSVDSSVTEGTSGSKSDSNEVAVLKSVGKPIMVEENASFNLVTNKTEEVVETFHSAALSCEELMGSISDTEDNTSFPVKLQNSSQLCESSQEQLNSSTADDVSSQEHCSSNSTVVSQEFDSVTWTIEDDKLILEMVKINGAIDSTYEKIAMHLRDKTTEQVRARFKTILAVLCDENDSDEATDEEDDS